MGCCRTTSVLFIELVLLIINLILLTGGGIVLFISMEVRHTGWIEVMKAYVSSTDTIITALDVVGWTLVAIAILGSVAACCRWRLGLMIYAILIFFFLLVFLLVAVCAFKLEFTAKTWNNAKYPADKDEEKVREKFDQVYCYAQGAYVCNTMAIDDAVKIFLPGVPNIEALTKPFSDSKGVNSLCTKGLDQLTELQPVCDGCKMAAQFKNLSSILDWANDQCPRTSDTLVWCGNFLATSSLESKVGTNPYTECRSKFLDLVDSASRRAGIGCVVVCIGAILVIGFSCFLRKRDRRLREKAMAQNLTPHAGAPILGEPYNYQQHRQDQNHYHSRV